MVGKEVREDENEEGRMVRDLWDTGEVKIGYNRRLVMYGDKEDEYRILMYWKKSEVRESGMLLGLVESTDDVLNFIRTVR